MATAAGNIFESNAPLQGDRATETAHRKIELQSPADLTYLIANVTQAARQKINRDLPAGAVPEGEDAMRKRVEQLVDEYIRNTFGAAKDSISINGMDSKEMEAELAKAQEGEEIEPFDTKLAQRIQALSAQIEDHTLQLADLRRTAPAEASKRTQDSFARQSQRDDATLQKAEEELLQQARSTNIAPDELERRDEIQATYQSQAEVLSSLNSGLPGSVAVWERAQKAVDYIENERK